MPSAHKPMAEPLPYDFKPRTTLRGPADAMWSKIKGAPGKLFDWSFSNPVGIGASLLLLGGAEPLTEAFNRKPMAKAGPGIKMPQSMKYAEQNGRTAMNPLKTMINKIANSAPQPKQTKTVADWLLQKMASANEPVAKLPFKVSAQDREFLTKVASDLGIEKKAIDLTGVLDAIGAGGKKVLGMLPGTKEMGDLGRWAARAAVPAAALGGLGYMGAAGAGALYDKVSDAIKRYNSYNQMFEEVPTLNEYPREVVDKYWGLLMDFAPKLAINPIVAGQFIQNTIDMGNQSVNYVLAKDLIGTQNLAQTGSGMDNIHRMMLGLGQEVLKPGVVGIGGGATTSIPTMP